MMGAPRWRTNRPGEGLAGMSISSPRHPPPDATRDHRQHDSDSGHPGPGGGPTGTGEHPGAEQQRNQAAGGAGNPGEAGQPRRQQPASAVSEVRHRVLPVRWWRTGWDSTAGRRRSPGRRSRRRPRRAAWRRSPAGRRSSTPPRRAWPAPVAAARRPRADAGARRWRAGRRPRRG